VQEVIMTCLMFDRYSTVPGTTHHSSLNFYTFNVNVQ